MITKEKLQLFVVEEAQLLTGSVVPGVTVADSVGLAVLTLFMLVCISMDCLKVGLRECGVNLCHRQIRLS